MGRRGRERRGEGIEWARRNGEEKEKEQRGGNLRGKNG